ncbi:hypothetical protein BJ085DRAFT_12798, partial [Dimargaris cristalligena]
ARIRQKPLAIHDIVLEYDSSLDKQWSRKFDNRWRGPYKILDINENGSYTLAELDGTPRYPRVNGDRLKKFY